MTGAGPLCVYQVTAYYPPHVGGMEVVAQTVAEELVGRGLDVHALTSRVGQVGPDVAEVRNGVSVQRLRAAEVAHTPVMPGLLARLLRAPRSAIFHVHIGVAFAPEAVWLVSKLLRRPFVAHYHLDVDPSGRFGRLFVLYKRYVLSVVLRSAARVFAVSPDQPEVLVAKHGVDPDRIVLLPNGVGRDFRPVDRRPPAPGAPLRVLFVGRLAAQKNLPLLLTAVAAMRRPAELTIVGEGEDRGLVERMVEELGLANVRLVGAKRGRDLVDAYGAADVLVMTSVKESTGLVLLEAFATGLPVIAADAPGVRTTVGDDGLLAGPTPEDLAAFLDLLADDPDLWCELAARSGRRGTRHGWDSTIDRLVEIYTGLDSERASGAGVRRRPRSPRRRRSGSRVSR